MPSGMRPVAPPECLVPPDQLLWRRPRQSVPPWTSLPMLLRQVVLEAPGKGEQKRHRVGGEMLVVAAIRASHDDVALDRRIVEIGAAEVSARRTDPAQPLRPREQFGCNGRVGG